MIDTTPFINARTARVLAFGAHPDDLDFGAAGTVAALTAAGVEVQYCIMTDGDAGGFDDRDPELTAKLRHEEQKQAAAKVGVSTVHFLGERDGFLEANHDVMRKVVRLMRQVKPTIVIAMHPERKWERIQAAHPDHLACGEAVTRAIYPAVENPFSYPELLAEEGLEAYKVPWLWLCGAPQERENAYVDITEFFDKKMDALRSHFTQHPDVGAMENYVLQQCEENAQSAGLAQGKLAEAFHVVAVNASDTIAGF
ncbi:MULTISPECIES: PIG-L deacetylase family protein [Glutamicibacter]|jgi:LmbE family N-acetylglucosaminyl deacetylase|uniref:PIG-L family deacetylase n=2 Tax=Glutamicibacter arilaitensis TaxID=256701 RepID=A0A2N7S313_9MICC|nr:MULTISPECIES: PIG-L deacetylase family protein [Glutamicibacter]PMQ20529.1 PIG-L family deacetylase [Glutamicibacter arilaitensis]CBT76343.1 LmbE family protein [Glutamicibacter arilaitensis Re117]HCH47786.1 PIG-L family deacetylase [Glutamicibacter sp.]HCJ55000.1 PIG-L family deacetylase [Glutamicibacter sp.]HCM94151.1 PIG-L family deacetylase [Glutamicibacter sp.]